MCVAAGLALAGVGAAPATVGPDIGSVGPNIGSVGETGPPRSVAASTSGGPAAAPEPAAPTTIELPAGGVRAPIVPVGVAADGLLQVPDPPRTVGWWQGGVAPGAPSGSAVLAGHVDSATAGLGVFAVLRRAAVGDPAIITRADGTVLRYRVTARRSYLKQDLPAEVFARAGPARLVMITCGGTFDRRTRHYTDNVVVYATPEPAPGS